MEEKTSRVGKWKNKITILMITWPPWFCVHSEGGKGESCGFVAG
jgi:hypothetical protein